MDVSIPKSTRKPACRSEFDALQTVILCRPEHMAIKDIINGTQKHFKQENINIPVALKQHSEFIDILRSHQIEVVLLPADPALPEQVFTRDIGFVLGETAFISNMAASVRQGEETVFQNLLDNKEIPYTRLKKANIEGGDILIADGTVYAGLSKRTDKAAVRELQEALPEMTVVPIPLKEDFLHLDCVFNMISETEALYCKNGLRQKEIDLLAERFEMIEVPEEEQFTLGPNILSIGNQTIISLPQHRHTNRELRKRGYTVIETEFSEIIKSGGSFRCCTLPLVRTS
ncbi:MULTISPECIES: dimethylarginine dimethylaminohydrolase family protein [Bacillus amyloliquefaciens group]|uniref:Dimethylarginine dimethylaminohydrolase family protein n=1 Tax=Bacillus amyloliquefaciens TaxID=1390 RepID=A0AAP4DI68_BACAM|nr:MULTISPECIES: dimethylarginine dimethylaminohydrolase family protein [Bacillus amyloliquefaciens group]MDF4194083.1 dimethylarginine dimethylaminohydrolase family protein [Bacillus amyloliquefaciens]MDF4214114.1 dimethylarginine dimethylaminohydrolase family protein [Bacillus amyloliquefaciens]MDH3121958.1 dimethylarginine dimethylaminohydrolase family protein [Bacillus velezensis]QOE05393.1 dimethylarginine dimethylaminohydrolase family protein [Bacillus amyloliquefaciens]QZY34048.1 dimeth